MPPRRWTSRVFTCLSAVSLAMAVLVAGLWVRNNTARCVDLIAWHSSVDHNGWQSGATLIAKPGFLAAWAGQSQSDFRTEPGWTFQFHSEAGVPVADNWDDDTPAFFGVSYRHTKSSMPGNGMGAPRRPFTERYIAVSSPLLVTLFLAAPAGWWISFRRHRRLARIGHCPSCGYDLRASPNRCPECGQEAKLRVGNPAPSPE